MTRQAALYIASADDVHGARLRVAGRPVAFRTLLAPSGPLGFLGLDGTAVGILAALVFFNLGVLLEDMERKAEAAESYQAALQLDPRMADGHYNLALVCEKLGRPQEAIRHMAQYRKLVAKK